MTALISLCEKCGAQIEYEAGKQSLKCPYCGAITEIIKEEDVVPASAEKIIPLTVDKDVLTKAVQAYMASGDYTPDDLLEAAQITKNERLYVPGHIFWGRYVAKWTATFGFDREETYTVYENRKVGEERTGTNTFRSVYGQVPVTKTKTVTDWRPVNGEDAGTYERIAYAGKILNSPGLVELAENCSGQEDITAFDGSFITGITVEPFSATDAKAYAERIKERLDRVIDASVKSHAQGDHQRDWHWTASISKNSATALLPICHVVFEYQGAPYNFWADGTDVSRFVADSLPEDQQRKSVVAFGYLPAVSALAAMPVAGWVLGSGLIDGFTWAGFGAVQLLFCKYSRAIPLG